VSNLKKKKQRYMFIATVEDKQDQMKNTMAIACIAKLIRAVGTATWLEAPDSPVRRYQKEIAANGIMDLIFTCSIRKEKLSDIRNAFFESYPDGFIRSLELSNY